MKPLAERMRPKILEDVAGQGHIVGQGAVLRKTIEAGVLPSMILWGPPGVGKTTLAFVLAGMLKRNVFTLSAIDSGVKEVREIINNARKSDMFSGRSPVLFIDEIHRFSKSQQDSLLHAVEEGIVTLIGATTENPSFEVISALLSRCQIYTLKLLSSEDLKQLAQSAIQKDAWLAGRNVKIEEWDVLLNIADGDARRMLNSLELVVQAQPASNECVITNTLAQNVLQQNAARYDKNGEQHYDIISAFIKSIRGSDPNAGVYWLARMVEGGEKPEFIARRLVILAAEDIGNANPTALVVATNCFTAVHMVGWPESRIILSQCVTYLASSPKSNAAYLAINEAQEEVRRSGSLEVPFSIRNAPTRFMKDSGYGKGYQYDHDSPHNNHGGFANQEFLPEAIKGRTFYRPLASGREKEMQERLKNLWKDKYAY